MENIKFESINLYCENPAVTNDFFNYLFEAQAQSIESDNEISLNLMGIPFMLLKHNEDIKSINPLMTLSVSRTEQLKEIFQKLHFYSYKQASKDLIVEQNKDSILFKDPDSRLWEIKLNSHNI